MEKCGDRSNSHLQSKIDFLHWREIHADLTIGWSKFVLESGKIKATHLLQISLGNKFRKKEDSIAEGVYELLDRWLIGISLEVIRGRPKRNKKYLQRLIGRVNRKTPFSQAELQPNSESLKDPLFFLGGGAFVSFSKLGQQASFNLRIAIRTVLDGIIRILPNEMNLVNAWLQPIGLEYTILRGKGSSIFYSIGPTIKYSDSKFWIFSQGFHFY